MFQSFFIAGFECSTHIGVHNNRHDLISATGHDVLVQADYRRLRDVGITTAREGLRWHLIETAPNHYDFSTVLPVIRAARSEGIQVIWDLFHYGFPTDLNPFEQSFVDRFAKFSQAVAKFLKVESDENSIICPFNEISFFSYAAGERGFFGPHSIGRGSELKRNCVRAALVATDAFKQVLPDARFAQIEPSIDVRARPDRPEDSEKAELYRTAQFEAYDMIAGRLQPELGGRENLLDIIGVNYYNYNQWFLAEDPNAPGITIYKDNEHYRPFHTILEEIYARYQRPLFIAETGAENEDRVSWLRYVCNEVRTAIKLGVPVSGICWYPILNHPGWDDNRHCYNGMWDYPDSLGYREVYEPLAAELKLQSEVFERDKLSHGFLETDLNHQGNIYSVASAF